jgi:hypothetical protein
MDDASAEEVRRGVLPQDSDEPKKITYMDAGMSVEGNSGCKKEQICNIM